MRRALRRGGIAVGFWFVSILLWEFTTQTVGFDTLGRFLPGYFFALAAALAVAALTLLPGWAGRIASWLIPPALFLVYAVQLVYHHIFSAFLSLAFVTMGGEAVAEFWPIVLQALGACAPRLLLLALPLVAFYLCRWRGWLPRTLRNWKLHLGLAAGWLVVTVAVVLALPLGGTGPNTPYAVWRSSTATVDRWADRFGLLTAEMLDVRGLFFSGGGPEAGGMDLTAGAGATRNILPELDLDALDRQTEDKELLGLNRYFSGLAGTGKNAYTGMFEDYNLIVVCAEGFSPYLMDPERTPTLWRLSHEGIVFENFYNSFPSLTTDGEYGLCMGLMPDISRISFAASMDNYLPFCLGRQFSTAGRPALAYHNNVGTFYNRVNTHTNMGYDFKAVNFGLDMEQGTPASDLEMMEKSVDEYIGKEPFHAYYMTFSGHAYYNFTINQMSIQNQELVEDIEGPEELKAYYACQLELERAMTYLVERLEEAGIAERTVIVLTGDHYPYGLPDEVYQMLAGEEAVQEPFWRYRNSFICWTAGLEEPMVVDEYCCTQDILPTLSNLFGLPYDSRLLTGRDILADCTHIAILKDGSFLTRDLLYDAGAGELTWRGGTEDEEYAQALLEAVENQFAVAAAILDTDYYGFAFSALGLADDTAERVHYTSFGDTAGTWYEEDVELLSTYGALSGGGTGDFNGERPINRAAVVTMVTRWLRLDGTGVTLPFSDVHEEDWFYDEVAAAWAAGLLPAGEEQLFPEKPMTGAEVLELFVTVGNYAGLENSEALCARAMTQALAGQRVNGSELPKGQVSRGAAASVLAAIIRAVEGE